MDFRSCFSDKIRLLCLKIDLVNIRRPIVSEPQNQVKRENNWAFGIFCPFLSSTDDFRTRQNNANAAALSNSFLMPNNQRNATKIEANNNAASPNYYMPMDLKVESAETMEQHLLPKTENSNKMWNTFCTTFNFFPRFYFVNFYFALPLLLKIEFCVTNFLCQNLILSR